MNKKDKMFAFPIERATDFDFGEETAKVFDDMVSRSVPFYDEVQYMIGEIIANIIDQQPLIYDLGCSTGTTMVMLANRLKNRNPRIVGVDSSISMIEIAKKKFEKLKLSNIAQWKHQDLNEQLSTDPVDVFIMNLTLQFIRPLYREQLVLNLYNNLKPSGCLILVEKVTSDNSFLNRAYIEMYHAFKKRNGYSDLEIAQKREGLENILIPYRVNENLELLERCGFVSTDIFFRWFNFAGFIAIK